jgi:hypothetical protein|tara:strand:+ start:542 stop:751 length:210 start_codon:yes stop_codon:yes gene_type:complete
VEPKTAVGAQLIKISARRTISIGVRCPLTRDPNFPTTSTILFIISEYILFLRKLFKIDSFNMISLYEFI